MSRREIVIWKYTEPSYDTLKHGFYKVGDTVAVCGISDLEHNVNWQAGVEELKIRTYCRRCVLFEKSKSDFLVPSPCSLPHDHLREPAVLHALTRTGYLGCPW